MLETQESIQEGGKVNGPALIPRKSGESPLILYLQGKKKPRMPFGSAPLPEVEIALIQSWIDQLPEEEPRVALRNAEGALAVAEKQLAWARANLPAVEARIEADKAKFADPPNPQAESLGKTARQLERQSQLCKAEENVLKAQQKLSEALSLPETRRRKGTRQEDQRGAQGSGSRSSRLDATSERLHASGRPVSQNQQRPPPGSCALDDGSKQSVDRARGDQSHLAASFRKTPGSDGDQLRSEWEASESSGAARLAGQRVHGKELEHEGDSSRDGNQQYVPHAVFSNGPGASQPRYRFRKRVSCGA